MSPASSASTSKKVVARVGLYGLDDATTAVLRDCFRQFKIATEPLGDNAAERLHKEKFEACVLPLDDHAEPVLQAARSSRSNKHAVIYGVASSPQAALRYSKYGINTVLAAPVERAAALKVVRSTYILVLHEFRRYVRVPITIEVKVIAASGAAVGVTQEISGGGMSAEVKGKLEINDTAELQFTLPNQPLTRINAVVCWLAKGLAGFRFDPADTRRAPVKQWIEEYLEIT